MSQGSYISYLRVSTQRQGQSGLGLEAQRASVAAYLNGGQWQLAGEFVEVESGRKSLKRRPELRAALDACRKKKAVLIVARLDRLSRDARMLLELVDAGVAVRFVDLPDVGDGAMGRFVLTMMAALAELEAKRTGERTKAALQAAKARGVKLGTAGKSDMRDVLAARMALADANAQRMRDVIEGCQKQALSQRATVQHLNDHGHKSPQGKAWSLRQLQRTVARLATLQPAPKRGPGRPRRADRIATVTA